MPFPAKDPLTAQQLLDVFAQFDVRIALDPSVPEYQRVLSLAHGLVGTVEFHAMLAEHAATAAGDGPREIGQATAQAFNGANCQSPADDLQLLSWEATRLTQRIHEHAAQQRGGDQLMKTIEMTAAALSGLLNVAQTMVNPLRGDGESREAAALLPKAITALEQAAKQAGAQRFVADLLRMTD